MNKQNKIVSPFLVSIFFLLGIIVFSGGKWERNKYDNFYDISVPTKISANQLKIDVLHYDLNIDLDADNSLLKGDVIISGVIIDSTLTSIDLNFYDNLGISSLTLNGKKAEYSNTDNMLQIKKGGTRDTFNIEVVYQGTPKHAGLAGFVFGEINKTNVVYNLSEPNYASSWFPCNDIPSDKAFLDMRITNDSSQVSASNGILEDIKINGTRKTYHWKTLYPIATYLIAVYSAHYVTFSDKYISQDRKDTLSILYYVFPRDLKNAKIDLEDQSEYLDFFAKTFGEYPFIKEKYGVAEFLWQYGAMEHQTLTGIGSNFVNGKKLFSDVFIHELSHHWWGDAVSPATWKDIWLNEGFATYSEALYAEHLGGSAALQATMISKYKDDFEGKLYNPVNSLFGPTVYDKGAWVLHMLRRETGDSLFFKILRTWFETYKYKNASTADFRKMCQVITNKDFTKFFAQWVYNGEGKIEVNYSTAIESAPGGYKLKLLIEQTQKEYNTYFFPLDFKFTSDNGDDTYKTFYIDFRTKEFEVVLKDLPRKIEADPNGWLLASIKKVEK